MRAAAEVCRPAEDDRQTCDGPAAAQESQAGGGSAAVGARAGAARRGAGRGRTRGVAAMLDHPVEKKLHLSRRGAA